jgi:hypothetical protein
LNIIPAAAQPELDNECVGNILGRAVHAVADARRRPDKRVGGWQTLVPEEHLGMSTLPDLDELAGDQVHERLKVCSALEGLEGFLLPAWMLLVSSRMHARLRFRLRVKSGGLMRWE